MPLTHFASRITYQILEKMTGSLKRDWTKTLNLTWGSDQQERESVSDLSARLLIRAGAYMTSGGGASALTTMFSSANAQTPGGFSSTNPIILTEDEAKKVGYWPITKAVVDAMRADVPAGGNLLFSGHSQGGARAQLAGMYTKKKYSEDRRVVTFSAVGSACFPRLLYSGANLLDDVDPTLQYPLFTGDKA